MRANLPRSASIQEITSSYGFVGGLTRRAVRQDHGRLAVRGAGVVGGT
ncbi:hypothetical protein [Streptomyces hokutonensis]|uniref:Uncharacterized protein n=1 Tax=Streptomyces hokutonensis TaxID=1306990 RepID=A0ABW6MG57_9ACTN